MNDDERELYQALITEHDKRPRNFFRLEGASHSAEGNNPVCGDRYVVYLEVDGDWISKASFEGYGCAISKASASMMTSMVAGRRVSEALALFDVVHEMLLTKEPVDENQLGDLVALSGVRNYPIRVKCASLAWHTMRSALMDEGRVSTE